MQYSGKREGSRNCGGLGMKKENDGMYSISRVHICVFTLDNINNIKDIPLPMQLRVGSSAKSAQ